MTSSCFDVYVGSSLQLTSGFNHIITIFGQSTSDSKSFSVYSYLSQSQIQIGNFITLQSMTKLPTLELMVYSTSEAVEGIIRNATISLFDSSFQTNMTILGNDLTFQGISKIFGNFDVQVVGTFLLNQNRSDATLSVLGEFLNEFKAYVTNILNDLIEGEVNDILIRRNISSEGIDNAIKWRDDLDQHLKTHYKQMLESQEQLVQANQTYQSSETELNNIIERIDNVIDSIQNYSDLFQEYNISSDLCIGHVCNKTCLPGVNCSLCSMLSLLDISYLCNMPGNSTQSNVEEIPIIQWQYNESCRDCWKVTWYQSFLISQEKCCVMTSTPYTKQYTIKIPKGIPIKEGVCNISSYNESTTTACCHSQNCMYSVDNLKCILDSIICQQEQLELLQQLDIDVNESLSLVYDDYVSTKEKFEQAKINLVTMNLKKTSLEEQYFLLRAALRSANDSVNTKIQGNISLYEETQFFQELVDIKMSSSNIIEVTNVSFNLQFTTMTPTTFPVLVEYKVPHLGQRFTLNTTLNIMKHKNLIGREMSIAIMESYFVNQNKTNQSIKVSSTADELCNDTIHIREYIQQLLYSINASYGALNDSLAITENTSALVKSLVSTTISSIENFPENNDINEQAQIYYRLFNDSERFIQEYGTVVKKLSFPFWQSGMEYLHVNASRIEPFGCSSFSECLQAVVKLAEIISKTIGIPDKFINLADELPKVGYDKNLSYGEAQRILSEFQTVVNSFSACNDPPIARIKLQQSSVDILVNRTVHLSCEAKSVLPVRFHWMKDNVILPNVYSNSLVFKNVQLFDSGQYSCIASNDAGSTTSKAIIITIHTMLELSVSPPSVMYIYEDYANGVDLVCDANSSPQPGWKWFYKQNIEDKWQVKEGIQSNVYTLLQPKQSDEGWYQCMAYNVLENITSDPMYLHVLSPVVVTRVEYTGILHFTLTPKINIDYLELTRSISEVLKSHINTSNVISFVGNQVTTLTFPKQLVFSFKLQTFQVQYNSLQNIFTKLHPVLLQLESNKNKLITLLQRDSVLQFTIQSRPQNATIKSFQVGYRTFNCPSGYELHSDRIVCSK